MKTAISQNCLKQAMSAMELGYAVSVIDHEVRPRHWRHEFSPQRRVLARYVRMARTVFRSNETCVSVKYRVATQVRKYVRDARNSGVISFECCDALQRALDY
jgi:hypothetical protein